MLQLKTTGLLLIAQLSAISAIAGIYSGPIDDATFNDLETQVESAYLDLINKMAEAESAGVNTDYAETTRITVQLFKDLYVPWDRENPSSHHSTGKQKKDPLYQNYQNTPGVAVPFDELADCLEIIQHANYELQLQIDGEIVLEEPPDFSVGSYALNGAYYELDGEIVIPSKIFWQPESKSYWRAYGRMGGEYYGIQPSMTSPSSIHAWQLTNRTANIADMTAENVGPIEFWHGTVIPSGHWTRTDFPEVFETGNRFFNHYDIDNPQAREWESFLLENFLAPMVQPSVDGGGVRSHLLNNEPRFPIRRGNNDAANNVSSYTFSKFATWLRNKYGSIDELNTTYGQSYADFSEASTTNYLINDGVSESLQGGPIWYDWCKFNQERVNDWFVFLNDNVQTADPTGHTHIKIWGGASIHAAYQDQGIDYEFLTKLVDIPGSDSQFTPLELQHDTILWNTDWKNRYMFDWRQQSVMMDFIKSIAPDKPYQDSEWHGIDGSRWLSFHNTESYLRPALWLAASHGLSAINTWFLNRREDGSLRSTSQDINGTFATQPIMMNAYGRIMKEINAHAETFSNLVPELRNYVIYYSMDSAIQDVNYSDQMTDVYESLKLLNVPIGFTTPSDLANVADPGQTLIIPRTEFISDKDLAALKSFAGNGGSIVLVDATDCFSKDELGFMRSEGPGFTPFATVDYNESTFTMAEALEAALEARKPEQAIQVKVTSAGGASAYGVLSQQFTRESGNHVVMLVNANQSSMRITLELLSGESTDLSNLITGEDHQGSFTMDPQEVLLLEHYSPLPKIDMQPRFDVTTGILSFQLLNDTRIRAHIQTTHDLTSAEWTSITEVNIESNNGQMVTHNYHVGASSESKFFRIVVSKSTD